MRGRWIAAGLLLFGVMWLAWSYGVFEPLFRRLEALANQPEAQREFNDPVSGRVDAMILMVSLFVLAPAVVFISALIFAFGFICVSLLVEPLFRALRLPGWTSMVVMLMASGIGLYQLRGSWLPHALYILGVIVRAWMVYFSSPVLPPR
jgi:hypothetical protein